MQRSTLVFCLKRCELFIKGSHVGNNFLSAFTSLLKFAFRSQDDPEQALYKAHSSLPKAAAMRYGCTDAWSGATVSI